jgi:sigma-B regulation protein RsbU (phosphoserine phosphatase)
MTPIPRTLIADDQTDVLEALRLLLKGEGYEIEAATSPEGVLEKLKSRDCDVLLMDLNYARDTTSGEEGLSLLSRIRAFDPTLPVVVMSAWGTMDLAVATLRLGVGDFVQKPWDNSQLLKTLRTQIEHGRSLRRMQRSSAERDRDFREASEIQRALLPDEIPQVTGYDIAGTWQPSRLVGGDYFDVIRFDEGRAALCIGDVVGKGIPAALLMSNLQAAVRTTSSGSLEPKELCNRVNNLISRNIVPGKFISFFYCLLQADSRVLSYTNAGHCPPMLLHADGSLDRLRTGGAVFGAFPDWQYEQHVVQLEKGDLLVLFTDGITEARNASGEEFGEERLARLIVKNGYLAAAALQAEILKAVSAFSGGEFQDDVTLLMMSVRNYLS